MKNNDVSRVIASIKRAVRSWGVPYVSRITRRRRDPFRTLISCIISLRTKDDVTAPASRRLFRLASTPRMMAKLSAKRIERAIYPAGFYRNKAIQMKEISRRIAQEHAGVVPDELSELLKFKGVGRKTANLVVSVGYGKPAICVDIHVHRIMNRLGYVRTPTPEKTELALRRKLPRRYWIGINTLLVSYGQRICTPISPWCSRCVVKRWCERRGVTKAR